MASSASCLVQAEMPVIAPAGKLREAIGLETLGGVFTPLLRKGSNLPCTWSQIFSTGENDQTEISLHLFRGDTKRIKSALSLGRFRISGIAPMPLGKPEILVEINANQDGNSLKATDKHGTSDLALVRVAP